MTKPIRTTVATLLGFAGLLVASAVAADLNEITVSSKKLSVLVVTGGHSFNEQEFLTLFQGYNDVGYKHWPQKTGGEAFEDITGWPYNAVVLYNYNQTITPRQQRNFLKLLYNGVGLVILHHANAAYNNWPEFRKIAGVEYHFGPWKQNGMSMEPSGYKIGVKFNIHVAAFEHPVTHGMTDFELVDETYCRTSVGSDVHPLLTTDEPTSDKVIGWTKAYGKSRVCYLQSGHDRTAYHNPNYRMLVVRAIRWSANSLP